uniref:Uncharacterized protein n=1 Tax=Chenopodium quinoa TaxID=63459 RepID=A0A803NBN7_CHEQI
MEDDITDCNNAISNVASYFICFISLLGLCHGLHILIKPFSQPRIISETINKIVSYSTCIGMILAMLLKIIYIPIVAKYIIRRARKRFPKQPLALQWHDPAKELRILLGFHGPENVPCAINLMEITKETGDPGIVVYATDMIELTDYIAATLAPGGVDALEVTDEVTIQNRQQITTTLQEYVEENGDGITLRRAMALATFNNMHRKFAT